MNLPLFLAVLTGKLIAKISHFLKIGGGSAAPGLYALKICPQLISQLTTQIPQTVVITGTNGKTTTARLLAHFARAAGLTVLQNKTGSNLERGLASTLILASHIGSGKVEADLAIWELDEAAFNQVIPQIKPDIIIFLNVFRDQLDRYGEVDTVIKKWGATLSQLNQNTQILINGDDQNLLHLKNSFKGHIQTFGVKDYKIIGEKVIHQKEQERLDWEATAIKTQGLIQTSFTLVHGQSKNDFTFPLPGIYQLYNFIAAYVCSQFLHISPKIISESLKSFSPAFGRMEKFEITPLRCQAKKEGYIFLIKNPAGAGQVLQTIQPELTNNDRLLIALNDNLADGTDVSWIWDVNFEDLTECFRQNFKTFRHPERSSVKQNGVEGSRITCSGTRAEDLALRLKYAGFNPNQLIIEPDLKKALENSIQALNGRLFILPTYTALLKLQAILASERIKQPYWKED